MEQSLQVVSRQERLDYWTGIIMARRSSGMTVRSWCQENNISEKTYYYWQKRLFNRLSEQQQPSQPTFAELTPVSKANTGRIAVTVRLPGAEADIHTGADAALVEAVLRVLKSC